MALTIVEQRFLESVPAHLHRIATALEALVEQGANREIVIALAPEAREFIPETPADAAD